MNKHSLKYYLNRFLVIGSAIGLIVTAGCSPEEKSIPVSSITVNASATSANDIRSFKFDGQAGKSYMYELSGSSATAGFYSNPEQSRSLGTTLSADKTGTYYLGVQADGSYSVRVVRALTGGDTLENQSLSKGKTMRYPLSTTLNKTILVSLTPKLLAADTTATGTASLFICTDMARTNCSSSVTNAAGRQTIRYVGVMTGTAYLFIDAATSADIVYNLSVSNPTALISGAATAEMTLEPRDQILYSFSTTKNTVYSVTLTRIKTTTRGNISSGSILRNDGTSVSDLTFAASNSSQDGSGNHIASSTFLAGETTTHVIALNNTDDVETATYTVKYQEIPASVSAFTAEAPITDKVLAANGAMVHTLAVSVGTFYKVTLTPSAGSAASFTQSGISNFTMSDSSKAYFTKSMVFLANSTETRYFTVAAGTGGLTYSLSVSTITPETALTVGTQSAEISIAEGDVKIYPVSVTAGLPTLVEQTSVSGPAVTTAALLGDWPAMYQGALETTSSTKPYLSSGNLYAYTMTQIPIVGTVTSGGSTATVASAAVYSGFKLASSSGTGYIALYRPLTTSNNTSADKIKLKHITVNSPVALTVDATATTATIGAGEINMYSFTMTHAGQTATTYNSYTATVSSASTSQIQSGVHAGGDGSYAVSAYDTEGDSSLSITPTYDGQKGMLVVRNSSTASATASVGVAKSSTAVTINGKPLGPSETVSGSLTYGSSATHALTLLAPGFYKLTLTPSSGNVGSWSASTLTTLVTMTDAADASSYYTQSKVVIATTAFTSTITVTAASTVAGLSYSLSATPITPESFLTPGTTSSNISVGDGDVKVFPVYMNKGLPSTVMITKTTVSGPALTTFTPASLISTTVFAGVPGNAAITALYTPLGKSQGQSGALAASDSTYYYVATRPVTKTPNTTADVFTLKHINVTSSGTLSTTATNITVAAGAMNLYTFSTTQQTPPTAQGTYSLAVTGASLNTGVKLCTTTTSCTDSGGVAGTTGATTYTITPNYGGQDGYLLVYNGTTASITGTATLTKNF
ncbi:MAG: hypothetical protein HQM12_08555 [SAR324 cluster bacterium]|nr:hypothetical protein [SAR324 cluster bacterium]